MKEAATCAAIVVVVIVSVVEASVGNGMSILVSNEAFPYCIGRVQGTNGRNTGREQEHSFKCPFDGRVYRVGNVSVFRRPAPLLCCFMTGGLKQVYTSSYI